MKTVVKSTGTEGASRIAGLQQSVRITHHNLPPTCEKYMKQRLEKLLMLNSLFEFQFHPVWFRWLEEGCLLDSRFDNLMRNLHHEIMINKEVMWPEPSRWFAAFEDDPRKIRVILLGQDPYPTPNRATGHSFEIDGPPDDSLLTIYEAIGRQQKYPNARINEESGNLSYWRSQGVFLLNTALSVCGIAERTVMRKGIEKKAMKPKSLLSVWRFFTMGVVRILCEKHPFLVFVLLGRPAANFHTHKTGPIKAPHQAVMSYHPSDLAKVVKKPGNPPLSLFSSVSHFEQVNQLLRSKQMEPIDWSTQPY